MATLDDAQKLQSTLDSARLHIVDSQTRFDARTTTTDESLKLPLTFADSGVLVDPASIGAEVKAQLVSQCICVDSPTHPFVQAFFRKLKFQYLEQKAKDQYIKIIVSDDAPSITAADNKTLQETNETKKRQLKEKKLRLAELQNNIRTLAPMVEQGACWRVTTVAFISDCLLQIISRRKASRKSLSILRVKSWTRD